MADHLAERDGGDAHAGAREKRPPDADDVSASTSGDDRKAIVYWHTARCRWGAYLAIAYVPGGSVKGQVAAGRGRGPPADSVHSTLHDRRVQLSS